MRGDKSVIMNDKQLTQILLVMVIVSSSFFGGVIAVTFFTKQVESNIQVVENGYSVTLYSDSDCTQEVTSLEFTQIMEGTENQNSGWIELYVKFNDNPTSQVYGHISTTSIPNGLTLEGQTYRFLTEIWDDLDISDNTCDFSNDPTDSSYTPRLRFRVTRTDSSIGIHSFQTIFTVMDTSTI